MLACRLSRMIRISLMMSSRFGWLSRSMRLIASTFWFRRSRAMKTVPDALFKG